jgi:hypothetical protein
MQFSCLDLLVILIIVNTTIAGQLVSSNGQEGGGSVLPATGSRSLRRSMDPDGLSNVTPQWKGILWIRLKRIASS